MARVDVEFPLRISEPLINISDSIIIVTKREISVYYRLRDE